MAKPPNDTHEATIGLLLAPVAQLMIRHGMTVGAATELLKAALVTATGDDVSDSTVTLKTGVHRKDVKRLRSQADNQSRRVRLSAAAMVLTRWVEDMAFRGADGGPRALNRKDVGKVPGFDNLVRRTKVDAAPATVLTELLNAGAVSQDDAGILTLITTGVVPADAASKLNVLCATAGAHLFAATQNVLAVGEAPYFDRALRVSHVSSAAAQRLDTVAREGAGSLLALLNTLAYDLKQEDILNATPRDASFVFGAFSVPDPVLQMPAAKDDPTDV